MKVLTNQEKKNLLIGLLVELGFDYSQLENHYDSKRDFELVGEFVKAKSDIEKVIEFLGKL